MNINADIKAGSHYLLNFPKYTINTNFTVKKHIVSDEIFKLFSIIHAKDMTLSEHQHRVAIVALATAKELGLDAKTQREIFSGALISNIGEIFIPDEVRGDTQKLNGSEVQLIRRHPESGNRLTNQLDLSVNVRRIILEHHERLDGSGYPGGLKDEDICLGAKITAVADTFTSMPYSRPYRPAHPVIKAFEEINMGMDHQFDRQVAAAFLKALFRDEFVRVVA